GSAHNPVSFHQINQVGGSAITNAQAPLQQGSGSLAELDDQAHRILEQGIVFVAFFSTFATARTARALLFRRFQEVLLIFGRALGTPELHRGGNFLFRNKRRVQPLNAGGAGGQIEHVAAAQQRLGAIGVQNSARIHLGGHAEGNAGGEVGLNQARNYVHRGALRSQNQV